MAGGAPMSPTVANRVLKLFHEFRPTEQADWDLSPHESRLLSLLVEGYNLKATAAELAVKRPTVAWHMRNIYEELHVDSKSGGQGPPLWSHPLNHQESTYPFGW
jgi:DNA-binding NarL/FixJ family response regulator